MTAARRVLVVDDDPAVRKSFDRVLTNKGYSVVTAASGEDALRRLGEEDFDLVFSDIRMPGMSGLEVAETIKAQRPSTPVVIITGYGTDDAEARAKAVGVSSFLQKPLSPEMIAGSARDVIAAQPAAKPEAQTTAKPKLQFGDIFRGAPTPSPPLEQDVPSGGRLRNLALFFCAPFVSLAYMIAMGGVFALMMARMVFKREPPEVAIEYVDDLALKMAAPVVGLVYVLLAPFIAIVMVLWAAARMVTARG